MIGSLCRPRVEGYVMVKPIHRIHRRLYVITLVERLFNEVVGYPARNTKCLIAGAHKTVLRCCGLVEPLVIASITGLSMDAVDTLTSPAPLLPLRVKGVLMPVEYFRTNRAVQT